MLVCEPKTLTQTNASPIQHLDASDTFGSIFKSRTIFNVPRMDCLNNVPRPLLRTSFPSSQTDRQPINHSRGIQCRQVSGE